MGELKDKDINKVIAEGSSKLASMPSGLDVWHCFVSTSLHLSSPPSFPPGGAAVASGDAAAADAPAEEKKEEKKEESENESDDDMGFGLFDWSYVTSHGKMFFSMKSHSTIMYMFSSKINKWCKKKQISKHAIYI